MRPIPRILFVFGAPIFLLSIIMVATISQSSQIRWGEAIGVGKGEVVYQRMRFMPDRDTIFITVQRHDEKNGLVTTSCRIPARERANCVTLWRYGAQELFMVREFYFNWDDNSIIKIISICCSSYGEEY